MIKIDTDNPTTNEAIKVWGDDGQLAILQEECAEVITAISRFNRKRVGAAKIGEECGDVIVCMMSVIKLLNIEDIVKKSMELKIERLEKRISLMHRSLNE